MNTVSADDDLSSEFRRWLDQNLPEEWRDVGLGEDEGLLVQVRRAWGKKLFDAGWAGPTWPKEYGGLGLSGNAVLRYQEELIRSGAPEPLNSNGLGVLAPTLMRFGTQEQKDRFLPAMLSHAEVWCQGFSEPEAGSDLASLRTSATREGDTYVLRGQKVWTSYAQNADWGYFLVRTTKGSERHAGLSLIVVPMDSPGISVRPLRNIAGSTEFTEVFLDDVIVPANYLIGEENAGWRLAMYSLSQERSLAMAQRVLKMEREFLRTLALLRDSQRPIEQAWVAEEYATVRGIRALVLDNVGRLDRGEELGRFPSVAKLLWSEAHQRILRAFVLAAGPDAVVAGSWWQQLTQSLLFSRAETVYGGTSEIQRNLIAQACGLPPSRPRPASKMQEEQKKPRSEVSASLDMTRELRRFLSSLWPVDVRNHDVVEHLDLERWTTLASSGWLDFVITLQGDQTSADRWAAGLVEVGEELGRALVPGPFLLTAGFTMPLLHGIGDAVTKVSEAVAGGTIIVSPVPSLSGSYPELRLDASGNLHGTLTKVPFAGRADSVLALARDVDGRVSLLRVPTEDPHVDVISVETMQVGQLTGEVRVHGLHVENEHVISNDSPTVLAALSYARATYHLLLSSMAVGGSEFLLDASSVYASERKQFGVPIGTFQSLRHMIADMRSGVDLARAATVSGWEALAATGADGTLDIAAARVVSSKVALDVAEKAIQIHGGAGFTWEQGLHRWYRAAFYQVLHDGDLSDIRKLIANTCALPL